MSKRFALNYSNEKVWKSELTFFTNPRSSKQQCARKFYYTHPPPVPPDSSHAQCEQPTVSLEVSSPIQSDEEEAMEVGDSPALCKSVHFKEPPSIQVGVSSNLITVEVFTPKMFLMPTFIMGKDHR